MATHATAGSRRHIRQRDAIEGLAGGRLPGVMFRPAVRLGHRAWNAPGNGATGDRLLEHAALSYLVGFRVMAAQLFAAVSADYEEAALQVSVVHGGI